MSTGSPSTVIPQPAVPSTMWGKWLTLLSTHWQTDIASAKQIVINGAASLDNLLLELTAEVPLLKADLVSGATSIHAGAAELGAVVDAVDPGAASEVAAGEVALDAAVTEGEGVLGDVASETAVVKTAVDADAPKVEAAIEAASTVP